MSIRGLLRALAGACVAASIAVGTIQPTPAPASRVQPDVGELHPSGAPFLQPSLVADRERRPPLADEARTPQVFEDGVVVLRAKQGLSVEVGALVAERGYSIVGRVAALDVLTARVPVGAERRIAAELGGHPAVEWADVAHTLYAEAVVPDDQYYPSFQSNLNRIGLESAWTVTTGDPSVVVAVLDTGVDPTHPDLATNLLGGYDFVNGDPDPSDDSSHGTAVAGIIAAIGNNGLGVAGVAWGVRILPVKVLDALGQGSDAVVAEGIVYATDNGARIVNISSSTVDESQVLRDAVSYAHSSGVLIVAAAGNTGDGDNLVNFPAAFPEAVAVAATDRGDKVPFFSQRQPYIGLSAPGVDIPSTAWDGAGLGQYALTTGTSAAAPHVSGVAALLLSVRPDLTSDQLRQVLEDSAQDVCPAGRDDASGFGRLDALRAIDSVIEDDVVAAPSATADTESGTEPSLPELPSLPALDQPESTTETEPPLALSDQTESEPRSWFFAEGSTRAPFETWLTLYNPRSEAGGATVTYMLANGESVVQQLRIPPVCRQSINVSDVVADAELSIRVDSADGVLAERSMYFGHDGTDSIGATAPSRTWYLAEGSTAAPFETWILLQNPARRTASVHVSFQREDGSIVVHPLVLGPTSRQSVYVNELFQAAGFSTVVESDVPIVVERAMYFDDAMGGHGTVAVPDLERTWYFAEGQTRGGYDTWLLVQNPNGSPTRIEVTFFLEDAAPIVRSFDVGARSRFSLYTNTILPSTTFGMRVESERPIVAERAVYFAQGRGGHDSAGVAATSEQWFLPEGGTSNSFRETIALLNPEPRAVNVTVLLTRGDGAPDVQHQVQLAPSSRTTLDVNRLVNGVDVSAQVSADGPIAVERTLSFAGGLGGTNAPGIAE